MEGDEGTVRRCHVGPETKGTLSFSAKPPKAGGFVTGTLEAEHLACDDGSTMGVSGTFRLAVTDTR